MKFVLFLYLAYATVTCSSARQAYIDISVKDKVLGRVVFTLRDDVVPKTVNNFIHFCTKPEGQGYKGSKFHAVREGQYLVGGDFLNGDGTGEISAYGQYFDSENFSLGHLLTRYALTTANKGPHKNTSQFMITLKRLSGLDGRQVAFGYVDSGVDVLKEISRSTAVDGNHRPLEDVIISDCVVL